MFVILFLFGIAGCGTPHQTASSPAATRKSSTTDESEKPPFIGMTKAQALARYGQPKKQTITDEGEQWMYILNFGEVLGKAFIPFNFHVTPIRTGMLIFGPDGRVKKFNWDTETDQKIDTRKTLLLGAALITFAQIGLATEIDSTFKQNADVVRMQRTFSSQNVATCQACIVSELLVIDESQKNASAAYRLGFALAAMRRMNKYAEFVSSLSPIERDHANTGWQIYHSRANAHSELS